MITKYPPVRDRRVVSDEPHDIRDEYIEYVRECVVAYRATEVVVPVAYMWTFTNRGLLGEPPDEPVEFRLRAWKPKVYSGTTPAVAKRRNRPPSCVEFYKKDKLVGRCALPELPPEHAQIVNG